MLDAPTAAWKASGRRPLVAAYGRDAVVHLFEATTDEVPDPVVAHRQPELLGPRTLLPFLPAVHVLRVTSTRTLRMLEMDARLGRAWMVLALPAALGVQLEAAYGWRAFDDEAGTRVCLSPMAALALHIGTRARAEDAARRRLTRAAPAALSPVEFPASDVAAMAAPWVLFLHRLLQMEDSEAEAEWSIGDALAVRIHNDASKRRTLDVLGFSASALRGLLVDDGLYALQLFAQARSYTVRVARTTALFSECRDVAAFFGAAFGEAAGDELLTLPALPALAVRDDSAAFNAPDELARLADALRFSTPFRSLDGALTPVALSDTALTQESTQRTLSEALAPHLPEGLGFAEGWGIAEATLQRLHPLRQHADQVIWLPSVRPLWNALLLCAHGPPEHGAWLSFEGIAFGTDAWLAMDIPRRHDGQLQVIVRRFSHALAARQIGAVPVALLLLAGIVRTLRAAKYFLGAQVQCLAGWDGGFPKQAAMLASYDCFGEMHLDFIRDYQRLEKTLRPMPEVGGAAYDLFL